MSEPVIVEIFIIGNEILIGDIQDTNTHWLCKEINSLGGRVARVTLLRDVDAVIAGEVHAALARGAEVIITSGGLGPTADDLTLAAVARGVGVEVRLHEQALQMVRDRYDELTAQGVLTQGGLNPAREKMAWLPEGAVPLSNPVGTAPGVLLKTGRAAIISLPGVPSELKGIFNSSLQPFLQETFRGGISVMQTITVQSNDESLMEPVLSRVVNDHPSIYIKSLARTLGETRELDITLTAVGSDQAVLDAQLGAALHDLQKGLTALGIGHREKERN
ncbi:competence/damage-inducible protein A [Geotalea uraniireducens]|uniref:Molybdopterin binding domain n=1 Tax=Geotalea uraniireducens (strain Rf4) TaxID=351605 RepID=A5G470_GEOUR|nr:molybdopterin-binding protein [Geotalea uraniireducens]ABQ26588.1 molybdopterin binding domain [Geotalea uraniireducens Rf4]